MAKIIETHIYHTIDEDIKDFQSRVIEVASWESFVDEIKNVETVNRHCTIGKLSGVSVPRKARIENLFYDNYHLNCDIITYSGHKVKKLAYLVSEN